MICSLVFLTFKQSKNFFVIKQNFPVPAASSGPKLFKTLPTVSLRTYAPRFALITEYDVKFIWSLVSLLTNFKPLS